MSDLSTTVAETTEAPADEIEETGLEAPEGTETPSDDEEDYEYEGDKYRLPKKLAEHVRTKAKEAEENGLRDRDYRHKTGEIAEARKQYAEALKTVQDRLKAYEPPKPDSTMLDPASEKYDRDAYYRARDAHDAWSEKMSAATDARKAEDAKTNDEAAKAKGERITKETQDLLRKVPEWKDASKRAAETTKIGEYAAKELGVSAKEFAEIDDHRLLVALRKAMLHDAAIQKASIPKKDPITPANPLPARRISGGGAAGGNSLAAVSAKGAADFIKMRNAQERAKARR